MAARSFATAALLTTVTASGASCGSPSCASGKCPTDNPVATLYGATAYPWTDAINWACVYSVADYGGSLLAAQAAAVSTGGGVVYLPAGVYNLSDNFVLASGVVLRGVPTTARAHSGSTPGPLAPTSRLLCPWLQHRGILSTNGSACNMGVVNLDLDGCAIMLWPELTGPQVPAAWDLKKTWYFAEGSAGMGCNKVVLSNRVHDVSYSNPDAPWHTYTSGNTWPWSFGVAISVYSDSNVLVGNNLIPQRDAARMFNTTVTLKDSQKPTNPPRVLDVEYMTDNRYGIDVNNVFTRRVCAFNCGGDQPLWNASCCPSAFRTGVAVVDNYVWQNGRPGVSFTGSGAGARGSGAQVHGNHVSVRPNTSCWSHDGYYLMTGADTNENRGYDFAGYYANITANTAHVNNQRAADTPYGTVDGEGILIQNWDATQGVGNVIVDNDLTVTLPGSSAPPGTGFLCFYDLRVVDNNTVTGNSVIASEFIGAMWHTYKTDGEAIGNICTGNSQPCVGMNGPNGTIVA